VEECSELCEKSVQGQIRLAVCGTCSKILFIFSRACAICVCSTSVLCLEHNGWLDASNSVLLDARIGDVLTV
jgi:hypothetical protein